MEEEWEYFYVESKIFYSTGITKLVVRFYRYGEYENDCFEKNMPKGIVGYKGLIKCYSVLHFYILRFPGRYNYAMWWFVVVCLNSSFEDFKLFLWETNVRIYSMRVCIPWW